MPLLCLWSFKCLRFFFLCLPLSVVLFPSMFLLCAPPPLITPDLLPPLSPHLFLIWSSMSVYLACVSLHSLFIVFLCLRLFLFIHLSMWCPSSKFPALPPFVSLGMCWILCFAVFELCFFIWTLYFWFALCLAILVATLLCPFCVVFGLAPFCCCCCFCCCSALLQSSLFIPLNAASCPLIICVKTLPDTKQFIFIKPPRCLLVISVWYLKLIQTKYFLKYKIWSAYNMCGWMCHKHPLLCFLPLPLLSIIYCGACWIWM